MITEWKDKKVAVLGFGVEGIETVRFLSEKGASLVIHDKRQIDQFDQDLVSEAHAIGADFVCGSMYLSGLTGYDVIVRSPGVRLRTPELIEAKASKVTITSHTKLFFDLCPAKIIGVTGTKGKGTTSSLIYEMLKEAGRDVYLGGNIGVPPLSFLDKLNKDSWVVLELSSFQLQDLEKSPHIGVMLMVTSEHLDHHDTLDEYVTAKRNILKHQTVDDYAIVNRDYPASNESDIESIGTLYYTSRERETDNGCFAFGNKVIVRKNGSDDVIIKTDEIALPGKHNLENVCAAVMAAKSAQVGNKAIVPALKKFTGLPHRLELVGDIDGVRYYDDSFSTTPETAIAAIEAFDAPKILILGGSTKHSDFSDLGRVIRESESIKAIIGVGEEWFRIKDTLGIENREWRIEIVEDLDSMKSIVAKANELAKKGDVVLLSPACASFGMFRNYKERGEHFQKAISEMAKK